MGLLIGDKIRALRKAKELSLSELSKLSGVQAATLSRIENNKMLGTVETHQRIAYFLGIELSDLYKNINFKDKSPVAFSVDNQTLSNLRKTKMSLQELTQNTTHKKMLPFLAIIQPHSQSQKEKTDLKKEEFIYILKGTMEAVIGDKIFKLKDGDALYFDASESHYFKNTGDTETQLIIVREQ